jgi:hypothetical protein
MGDECQKTGDKVKALQGDDRIVGKRTKAGS